MILTLRMIILFPDPPRRCTRCCCNGSLPCMRRCAPRSPPMHTPWKSCKWSAESTQGAHPQKPRHILRLIYVLCHLIFYYITLHYVMLHYIFYIMLYYIILYCIIWSILFPTANNLSMQGIGDVAIDGPRFEEFLRSRKDFFEVSQGVSRKGVSEGFCCWVAQLG